MRIIQLLTTTTLSLSFALTAIAARAGAVWEDAPQWQVNPTHIGFSRAYGQFAPRPLNLDDLTIGFEIEGHIHGTKEQWPQFATSLIPAVESSFQSSVVDLRGEGNLSRLILNDGRSLLIKGDKSVKPPPGRTDVEINSPVMAYSNYRRQVRAFLPELRAKDFSFTRTSATHVHVGYPFAMVSSAELILLNDLLHVLQKDLYRFFRPHSDRWFYISPIGSTRQAYEKSKTLQLRDPLANLYYGTPQELAEDLMYSDINPAVDIAVSLQAHGTIQLRLLNASYDPEELILAAELLARIIHGIHTHHPGLKNYLTTTPVTEIRLIEVARALGVPSFCYLALTGS